MRSATDTLIESIQTRNVYYRGKMQAVPEDYLVVLPESSRIIFQTILWPIVTFGIIGNLAVFIRIFFADTGNNSPLKPFYRSALLSLALSDLILLVVSGVNTLSMLNHRTLLWALPGWSCTAIPYIQTVAFLVASLTLAGVAIDRYLAIKSKYPLSKGLTWPCAVTFVIGIWAVSCAASYPVLDTYTPETLVVINSSTYYIGTLCIASRVQAANVFTALFAVIFVPLAAVFIIIHVLLALNIWQRNSPGDNATQQATSSNSQFSNENSTVSTSMGKPKIVASMKIGPTPTHVTRKRRTVRVILVLITVFGICRLPHWSFLLYKLHATTTGNISWYIQVSLTSLSLLNAAFHPFLYAFLNEALSLVTMFRAWCTRTRKPPAVLPSSEGGAASTISAKVPRGPYHSS